MYDILNVIHLKDRIDRRVSFIKEFKEQGIEYKIWPGIVINQLPFAGISYAHKSIIKDAKDKKLPRVIIAEDDIYFSNSKSWDYYISNIPDDFDLYFGVVYDSKINEDNRILTGFAGLTLYTVHERFYDTFLGMNSMNNLDRELGKYAYKYRYMVCPEFVAHQRDGFSDHKKANHTYGHLIKGRKMFGVD